jgi:hypothetical protein
MVSKRAQAGAAGSLLALLAVFILLYMLLIPPDLREELLNDGTGSGKTPSTDKPAGFILNETVFSVSPGRIDYLKNKDFEHPIPSVNLYSTTSAEERLIGSNAFVKNGIFDKKTANISFGLEPGSLENAYLSFALNPNRKNVGILTVVLNGNTIYEGEGSPGALPIDAGLLENDNLLSFEVSGVGYRFWTTNEYELQQIKVIYDRLDLSTQTSKNTFMVTDTEKFNLDKATLKFTPDCIPSNAGSLTVNVNSETVYSAVPDCGTPNLVDLSSGVLEAGNNRITFSSAKGRYLIDRITVTTSMKSMAFPRYDFELDDRLFINTEDEGDDEELCGEIDGTCPKGCDADLDKDCCLQETSSYWCDYQPSNQDDRCRAVSSDQACTLCASGYEDSRGDPPERCEDMCGDDTDNDCPTGCSRFYDMDCCFDESEDNFWCADIPKFGLATCKDAITKDECDACFEGWESDSSDFRCEPTVDSKDVLSTRYDIKLTLSFFDDNEKKTGKVYINGYQFYFYTYTDEYTRVIDNYVEPGTNTIKIEPDQTVLDIRKLDIEIEQ